jgi:hypothetical protein
MQDSMFTPVVRTEPRPDANTSEIGKADAGKLESGLGAWASAISGDDNAQAAIALAEAINRARNTQATRENRAADARVIAISRLETLRARLAPVYAAIPRDVELFDLGMVGHTPPRLFVDIIAFIEMAEDRRSFRLVQESRSGRVLLGETQDERQMTGLVTNYIAERLVERERALAARGVAVIVPPMPRTAALLAAEKEAGAPDPPDRDLQDPVPATVRAAAKSELVAESELAAGTELAEARPSTVPGSSPLQSAVQTAAGLLPAAAAAPQQVADAVPELASRTATTVQRAMPAAMPAAMSAAAAVSTAAGVSAAVRTPVASARQPGGGWIWPLLALVIGVGLGALLLYLYAANLARP